MTTDADSLKRSITGNHDGPLRQAVSPSGRAGYPVFSGQVPAAIQGQGYARDVGIVEQKLQAGHGHSSARRR